MKKYNKLFVLSSAALLALSLASCGKKDVRNTSVPLASLDTSAVIATNGDYKLTNDVFYDRLRYKGFTTVSNQIKKALFKEEYEFVKSQINLSDSTITDYEQELFDSYATDIFGTSSYKAVEKLTDDNLDTAIQKYIDSSSNKGIMITKENCKSYSSTEKGDDKLKFSYIPQEVIDEKLITIAMNKAAKDALEKIADQEKIPDEDDADKEVTNVNYVSETDLTSYYNSNQKTYGTYRAIVIQFNNLNEARNVITSVQNKVGALTESNALEFYVNLYNTYYNYRTPITIQNPFINTDSTKTLFTVNQYKNELAEMSSGISNLVTTTLEEDGQYIEQPFNQNNKYVMIYRGATEFELNKTYDITPYNEQIEWNKLKDNENAFTAVKAEVKDKIIESKKGSYSAQLLEKRIKNADIEIYDPYFELQFKNTYDEYTLITPAKFNNNLIFKVTYENPDTKTSNTTEYSVQNFYEEQSKLSALETVVEQFKLDYIYEFKDILLDSDTISDIEEDLNKAIQTFNKNENAAYPSSVGLNLFLLANYGYSTKENALKYNRIASSNLLNKYLSQTVFDEWALKQADGTYPESHAIDYDKLNILNNILEAGNANYSNLFSINIDHILIYIDDDADGSPDDPKEFLKNVNEVDFNAALLNLAKAIYAEANCEELTRSNSTLEILQYIVGAYNKNEALFSDPSVTWATYKKYNFLLTAESLSSSGDTTQSNVGTYVKEFGDYVKKLYQTAVENKLEIESKKSKFYFVESLEKAPAQMEDLCATQFGYHMIVVNSFTTPSTTKSTASSDQYGYHKNIEILLNELDKDTTDDNIYVIVPDTYNEAENSGDEKKATINQLFTYYVQKQKGATSSLDTSLRDVLSSMFDDAITRYTSTDFQNFLLFKELNIQITNNALLSQQLNNYEGYLKRTSQSYDTEDDFETWYNGSLNWARPYSK